MGNFCEVTINRVLNVGVIFFINIEIYDQQVVVSLDRDTVTKDT